MNLSEQKKTTKVIHVSTQWHAAFVFPAFVHWRAKCNRPVRIVSADSSIWQHCKHAVRASLHNTAAATIMGGPQQNAHNNG